MKKVLLTSEKPYFKANLHCHTTISDGRVSKETIKEHYKKNGYSIVAFTDHDVLVPHPELNDENFLELNGYEIQLDKWESDDYADTKTCIEFQHSYISFHFEEKNEFYRALSLQTVWLYDLSDSNVRPCADGSIDILEDNARGFFRISENTLNLRDNFVYIQVKSGKIYRVTELERRETSLDLKSTIRYFWPSEVYEEQEFVTAIQNNSLKSYDHILWERKKAEEQRLAQEAERLKQESERQREQEALQQQREADKIAREEAVKKAAEELARQEENAMLQEIQSANYEQKDEWVIIADQRWVLCTRCNQPKKEQDTPLIGFNPTRNPNKGICRDCINREG